MATASTAASGFPVSENNAAACTVATNSTALPTDHTVVALASESLK